MDSYTYEKQENLIEENEYEAIIDDAKIKTFTSGAECVSLTFKIRDDVEQKYKNRLVFESIWKEKEHPAFFNRTRLNQLLGTQSNIKDGQAFNTIDDILAFIKGTRLIIVVGKRFSDYLSKDENYVKYYKSSNAQPKKLGSAEPTKTNVVDDLMDSDLPF